MSYSAIKQGFALSDDSPPQHEAIELPPQQSPFMTKRIGDIVYCAVKPEMADELIEMLSAVSPDGVIRLTEGELIIIKGRHGLELGSSAVKIAGLGPPAPDGSSTAPLSRALKTWVKQFRDVGQGVLGISIAMKDGGAESDDIVVFVPSSLKVDLVLIAGTSCEEAREMPMWGSVIYEPSGGWESRVSPWIYVGVGAGLLGIGYLLFRSA